MTGSTAMSALPSATSTCAQKSPKPTRLPAASCERAELLAQPVLLERGQRRVAEQRVLDGADAATPGWARRPRTRPHPATPTSAGRARAPTRRRPRARRRRSRREQRRPRRGCRARSSSCRRSGRRSSGGRPTPSSRRTPRRRPRRGSLGFDAGRAAPSPPPGRPRSPASGRAWSRTTRSVARYARQRDLVGGVRELEREGEVVVDGRQNLRRRWHLEHGGRAHAAAGAHARARRCHRRAAAARRSSWRPCGRRWRRRDGRGCSRCRSRSRSRAASRGSGDDATAIDANASLISTRSTSETAMPARSSAFGIASVGAEAGVGRRHPHRRPRPDDRERLEPVLLGVVAVGDDDRAAGVVEAGRVARP